MSRYVSAIYSDDIRHEVGGKISIIGIYGPALLVQNFPATLPKLCMQVQVRTPADNPFKSVTFKILHNKFELANVSVSEQDILQATPDRAEDAERDNSANQVMTFNFVFSPVVLTEPGSIQIRAITESEELKGPSLRIDQAPEGTEFAPA